GSDSSSTVRPGADGRGKDNARHSFHHIVNKNHYQYKVSVTNKQACAPEECMPAGRRRIGGASAIMRMLKNFPN
ncbi:MAG: hypothetical protein RSH52_31770, partial [Janthinobacterium sp.]